MNSVSTTICSLRCARTTLLVVVKCSPTAASLAVVFSPPGIDAQGFERILAILRFDGEAAGDQVELIASWPSTFFCCTTVME
ncbi:hypothetical protein ACN9MY_27565 [Pseudoduganella sp. R-31]|uniref:hypothetical protein n=1 Tax=Pseudoduganella sp. R-31 TaxID=3404060 RepID=UPI003CF6129B